MATLDDHNHLLALLSLASTPIPPPTPSSTPSPSPFLRLPLELRLQIYTYLLLSPPLPPLIVRTPDTHLTFYPNRPEGFRHLLLVSRRIYTEAAPLPFAVQTFRLTFPATNFYEGGSGDGRGRSIPHNATSGTFLLCLPRWMEVELVLESGREMVQLVALRAVLGVRAERRELMRVVVGLEEVGEGKRKAVVRSLRALLGGFKARVEVRGYDDQEEEGLELSGLVERMALEDGMAA